MATEYPGTDRDFSKIIQGGAPDWQLYTQSRIIATGASTYPGRIMSGNGETEGEVDLAASIDGTAANYEIVLHRISDTGVQQDIDTQVTAGQKVLTLRRSQDDGIGYGRFIVAACYHAAGSTTELGEPLVLEGTGMLKKFAYADNTVETDTVLDCLVRCAEALAASTDDRVHLVYW